MVNGTLNNVSTVTEKVPTLAPVYSSESNIVGTSYVILSLALLLLCLTFNAVLIADREFKTLQAHRLMLFMGILDCIQLIGHTFGGVATIWKPINYDVPYLCQVMGAALNSAWVGLFPLSVLTAIQRLLIVRNSVQPNAKFSHAMKIIITLCFAYCIAFCICLLCVGKVTYFPDSFSWSYDDDYGSSFLAEVEFVVSVACIVLTFIIYITIVILLYKKTAGMTTVRRNENYLLVQASILFIILTSLITLWHFYFIVLPDTRWTLFSINIYWILYCGCNPILYLIFSKSIRTTYLRFIRILPPKKKTITSLVLATNSRS